MIATDTNTRPSPTELVSRIKSLRRFSSPSASQHHRHTPSDSGEHHNDFETNLQSENDSGMNLHPTPPTMTPPPNAVISNHHLKNHGRISTNSNVENRII
eukprot:c19917_g1_i5.p1 GENE.c19917_g1_i5~~c19917_g1_i5.p1  ORF type:complete len:100 (+),score=23.95 c19917_g1_i5:280-579(+)